MYILYLKWFGMQITSPNMRVELFHEQGITETLGNTNDNDNYNKKNSTCYTFSYFFNHTEIATLKT